MDLLLLAFTSLQLSMVQSPLPNISSWQRAGLDINGPFKQNINQKPPAYYDIRTIPSLYSCRQYGLKQVCHYHNSMHATYSIFWRQYPVYIEI